MCFSLLSKISSVLGFKDAQHQHEEQEVEPQPDPQPQNAQIPIIQLPSDKSNIPEHQQPSEGSPLSPVAFTIPEQFTSKKIVLKVKKEHAAIPLTSRVNEQTPLTGMRRVQTWSSSDYAAFHSQPLSSSSLSTSSSVNDIASMVSNQQSSSSTTTATTTATTVVLPSHSLSRGCCICLEEFQHQQQASVLPCLHTFHQSCLRDWLQQKSTCPLCRAPATKQPQQQQPEQQQQQSQQQQPAATTRRVVASPEAIHYQQIRRNLRAAQLL